MQKLDDAQRIALSGLLKSARKAKGLTQSKLAELAENELRQTTQVAQKFLIAPEARRLEEARARTHRENERFFEAEEGPAPPWSEESVPKIYLGKFERDDRLEAGPVIEVTFHHVAALENFPARPLGTPDRRVRLRAICSVLNVDRDLVNRICGGI